MVITTLSDLSMRKLSSNQFKSLQFLTLHPGLLNSLFLNYWKNIFSNYIPDRKLFCHVSVPHAVNRCRSVVIHDCRYPDKKAVKWQWIQQGQRQLQRSLRFARRHSRKLSTYCSFTTKIQLSCDGCPVTGCLQVTFLSLWLKEKKREFYVCTVIIRNAFLIFWYPNSYFFTITLTLVNKGDEIQTTPPSAAEVSKYTFSTIYCVCTCKCYLVLQYREAHPSS